MIRRPTPMLVLHAFWMRQIGKPVTHPAALAHLAQRHDEDPECGFYRLRLVKGGPFVPARIWMDQPVDEHGALWADETLRAEIDGRPASAATLERRWLWMRACTADDYATLMQRRARPDAVGAAMRATSAPFSTTMAEEFITP